MMENTNLSNQLHVTVIIRQVFIFFFTQKTSYEMRISDWSSDVCSSDLCHGGFLRDVLASRQKPVPPSTGKSRPRAATGLPCRCIGFQMDDISPRWKDPGPDCDASASPRARTRPQAAPRYVLPEWEILDRKSTRLNSSH